MSTEAIEQAIPHRPPMRLIDEVLQRDTSSIVCGKTFSDDEFFVQGHFPGQPVVPGVILCECCMQAGAVLLAEFASGNDNGFPVATRIDNVKFKRIVRPGDSIETHVTLNDQVSGAYFLTGKVLLEGKLAARLDFACTISEAPSAEAKQ